MTGDIGSEMFERLTVAVGGLSDSCLSVYLVESVVVEVVVDDMAQSIHQ